MLVDEGVALQQSVLVSEDLTPKASGHENQPHAWFDFLWSLNQRTCSDFRRSSQEGMPSLPAMKLYVSSSSPWTSMNRSQPVSSMRPIT